MARKKGKSISFDAMVKFFLHTYEIPTTRDVDKLMARLDRLESLIAAGAFDCFGHDRAELIGSLDRIMQLPQARQRPRCVEVDRAALKTRGFLLVEHAAAQGGGNAHHAIKLVLADKLTPLASDVLLILWRNDGVGGTVDAVLIKKQAHNLVPAGQRRLGEQQGAARGGRVCSGKQRDGELHGEL